MTDLSQAFQMPLQELRILEGEFLRLIDYQLWVSEEEIQEIRGHIIEFYSFQWNQELVLAAVKEAEQSFYFQLSKEKVL